ncbi:MAG: hypothetical protein D6732_19945 [Methanobacteriota archaeon]|nr:MAG: hypothetical protein D6732_19945 [Euryarchaeota archaeon]
MDYRKIILIVVALIPLSELVSNLYGLFFALESYAATVGISAADERIRLIILCVLDLAAGVPLLLFLKDAGNRQMPMISLVGFALYALYQIVSAFVQLEGTASSIALSGGIAYLLIGVLGFYISKRINQFPKIA